MRFLSVLLFAVPALLSAQKSLRIQSTDATVSLSRVTQLQNLVDRDGLTINLAIYDHGGSTDMSPTKQLYLTMYLKGEMFNVDAAFDLGSYFEFVSATRTAAGLYEIRATTMDPTGMTMGLSMATVKVDARQATVDIRTVRCDEMDCPQAERFRTAITMTQTLGPVPPARR